MRFRDAPSGPAGETDASSPSERKSPKRKLLTALAVAEVRAGTKDAEQAAREIQDDMNDLTDETLDAAKGADLPPGAEEQIEDLEAQLGRE